MAGSIWRDAPYFLLIAEPLHRERDAFRACRFAGVFFAMLPAEGFENPVSRTAKDSFLDRYLGGRFRVYLVIDIGKHHQDFCDLACSFNAWMAVQNWINARSVRLMLERRSDFAYCSDVLRMDFC